MIPATALAELGALYAKATHNTDELSGVACKHGWDTHVCPHRGCGPDVEADRAAFMEAAPALLSDAAELARVRAVLDDPATVEAVLGPAAFGVAAAAQRFVERRYATAALQRIRALVESGND